MGYNPAVRRFFILFLALLFPLQSAWSAAQAFDGHLNGGSLAGLHGHDHDHEHAHDGAAHDGAGQGDAVASAPAPDALGGGSPTHGDDGHHGCHVHTVFSMIPPDRLVGPAHDAAALPPPFFPTPFASHIPALFDRPPAVRV